MKRRGWHLQTAASWFGFWVYNESKALWCVDTSSWRRVNPTDCCADLWHSALTHSPQNLGLSLQHFLHNLKSGILGKKYIYICRIDLTTEVKTKQWNMKILAGRTQTTDLSAISCFSIFLKSQNKSHLRQNYSHTGAHSHAGSQKRGTERHERAQDTNGISSSEFSQGTFWILLPYWCLLDFRRIIPKPNNQLNLQLIILNTNNRALAVEISLLWSGTHRKSKSHSGMITRIHNSGYVKSDSDDLGKPKTPNTPEKFYFPRVSALILHSQGQISITVLPSLYPLLQTLEQSCQHTNHSSSAGICSVTNWGLLGFCVYILINAGTDLIVHNHSTKQEHLQNRWVL